MKWKKDNPLPLSSRRCSPTSIIFFSFSSLQWIPPIYLIFFFLFILFPFFFPLLVWRCHNALLSFFSFLQFIFGG
jgi:hypothetical protein